MNAAGHRAKNEKMASFAFEAEAAETAEPADYHERELRFIAAFRLRDAANRLATLVGMTRSPALRAELLAVYDRLMAEERELLVRSMETVHFKSNGPTGKSRKTA